MHLIALRRLLGDHDSGDCRSAAMPALPWKMICPVESEREYLALLTALPLRSYGAMPRFLRFTRQIQRQLSRALGLLGYSLLARPLRKQFWTLSVWEHEQALMEFVRQIPH
jgi:hypothetical protein